MGTLHRTPRPRQAGPCYGSTSSVSAGAGPYASASSQGDGCSPARCPETLRAELCFSGSFKVASALLAPYVWLPLHAALPFHCVLSFPDCCVHVLPASERTESRTSGWTLCSAAVGLRGFWDQDPFAPGVKCPPVCPVPGASHDRPLWASRKVCLLPCLQLAAVGNVPHFLRYLTTQLHQQVPRGLVLWYDSVVSSGQLTWQDELNEHNR